MKRFFLLFLLCLVFSLFFVRSSVAQIEEIDLDPFSKIAVLHEGRIKPLDTFARSFLLTMGGRSSVDTLSASAWLAELLFDQTQAYERRVFNVANPDVVHAINLPERKGHRYSFNEIKQALESRISMIAALEQAGRPNLSQSQNQLLDLYKKTLWYFEISRSLSLLLPDISIKNKALADKLELPFDVPLAYLDILAKKAILAELAMALDPEDNNALDPYSLEVLRLGAYMRETAQDQKTELFRIIPPQWEVDGDMWFSPWAVLEQGRGSPETSVLFDKLTAMAKAYDQKDGPLWFQITSELRTDLNEMAGNRISPEILEAEYHYNGFDPFYYSLLLYLLALLFFLSAQLFLSKIMLSLSAISLFGGWGIHTAGILARMYIMGRPPVATLYESILFVCFVAVLFSLVFEWKGRNGIGILTGAVCGSVLQFIGMRYSMDGDSMGMLLAVLDTNFWLATHVVTITVGYGCCFVSAFLAHLYILDRVFFPFQKDRQQYLYRSIIGAALVALFFSVLGTILGGIWADQSWGRFWGWDPKENGAMLVCLWLIWLLHGRLGGMLSSLSFAFGMVMTNIVVVLAWFGVNLLNVGLHSYGFTENIATNIILFSAAEILFALILWPILLGRKTRIS